MANGINNNLVTTEKKSGYGNFCGTFSDHFTAPRRTTFGKPDRLSISNFLSQSYKQPRQQNLIINSINSFSSSILDGMVKTGDRIGNVFNRFLGRAKTSTFNTLDTAKSLGTARVDIHEGAMSKLLASENYSEKAFRSITGAYPTRKITNVAKGFGSFLDTISGFKTIIDGIKKDKATGNNLYANTFLGINKSILKMASTYGIGVGAGTLATSASVAAAGAGIALSPFIAVGGAVALTLGGAYYVGNQIDKYTDRRAQAAGF